MTDWQKLYQKLRALWADSRPYSARLLLAGAVMLAFCFTFIFFGPLELVAFSSGSLSYTYRDVAWLLAGMALVVLLISAPLIALLRGRIYGYTVSFLAAVTVFGYLQALLFNIDLGLLTGDSIHWPAHRTMALLGLFVFLVVLVVFFFAMFMHRKFWTRMTAAISLILVVMQLVPTVAILCGAYDDPESSDIEGYHLSTAGFNEFSSGDNVFVFVLDRLDYKYIESALAQDPTFLDGLDGFTSYENAISCYARTKPALIHMLTGATEDTFLVPAAEYYASAWEEKGLLQTIGDRGYSVEMYTNIKYLFSDAEFADTYVNNATNGTAGLNYSVVGGKLLELSAFRYAPTALKPFFFADTNYYNEDAYYPDTNPAYQFDDVVSAQLLAEGSADRETPAFKFYHFYGSHASYAPGEPSYSIRSDGTRSTENTSVEEQTIGSFVNLMKVFDRMKELGIYEDATIIITGDHGDAISDTKPLGAATRIGLFYKPSGSAGTPLQHSDAPVSVTNIPATIAKATGADYKSFGTPLDEVAEDADITRYYYKTVCDKNQGYRETEMYIYAVTGDAANIKNWKLVEVKEIPHSYN